MTWCVKCQVFQMLVCPDHVESLNFGSIFKNREKLCDCNPGYQCFGWAVGGVGWHFHHLEKSFKVRGIVEARPLGNLNPETL